MTSDEVTRRRLAQRGLLVFALGHHERASGVESASTRHVQGRRHLSRQHDLVVQLIGMVRQHGREQRLGIGMEDLVEEVMALTGGKGVFKPWMEVSSANVEVSSILLEVCFDAHSMWYEVTDVNTTSGSE